MTHEIEIDCPPEGLTRAESHFRTPQAKGCKCHNPGEETLADMQNREGNRCRDHGVKYFPGQMITTEVYRGDTDEIICIYEVWLRKPPEVFDVVEAVNHDKAPGRRVKIVGLPT